MQFEISLLLKIELASQYGGHVDNRHEICAEFLHVAVSLAFIGTFRLFDTERRSFLGYWEF